MRTGGVEVRRLRVHGDSEPLQVRLRAGQLLGAADLRAPRLPPAAVLVVRELRDPDPGRLDLAMPTADRRWEQQVRDLLDDLVLRAARPAVAPPGPTDPAVMFTDRAELIACAWREIRRSGRASSWWWQALGLDGLDRVVAALVAAPEQVPAVCAQLDASGDLDACVLLLTETVAATLLAEVARAFGRSGLVAESRARIDGLRTTPDRAAPAASRTERRTAPPSRAVVTLVLRGSDLHAVLVETCAALSAAPTRPPSQARGRHGDRPPPTRPARRAGPAAPPRPLDGPDGPIGDGEPHVGGHVLPPAGAPAGGGAASDTRPVRPTPRVPPRPVDDPPEQPSSGDVPVRSPEPLHRNRPTAHASGELVVATGLGGLFHLVQVGQSLGLYADFGSPVDTGIGCGVWDFVTLLGRGLGVGAPRDPVWQLLADLEGREPGSPPGTGFRPPRTWRVPPGWLPPVDAHGPWRWREGPGPSALIHPTGFVVAEGVGLDRERECRRYGLARCVLAPPAHGRPPPGATARERWVTHLAAYTRVRLAAALGGRPARAGRTLCLRPASVHVTATRIDVVSDLADLAIEVRLAGLDRDPGFVPAAARSIGFTFR